MRYDEWIDTVSGAITDDALWRMRVYRIALYLGDIAWEDASRLSSDRRTRSLSDQLYRAVGSVSANIAEGYSRGTGRDRARFYEYSLGSARESRDWYHKARHVLGTDVSKHRMRVLAEIIKMLLVIVRRQRTNATHEPTMSYTSTSKSAQAEATLPEALIQLLSDVPSP